MKLIIRDLKQWLKKGILIINNRVTKIIIITITSGLIVYSGYSIYKNIYSLDMTKNKIPGLSDNFSADMTKYIKVIQEDYKNGTQKAEGKDSLFSNYIFTNYIYLYELKKIDKDQVVDYGDMETISNRDKAETKFTPTEEKFMPKIMALKSSVKSYNQYKNDKETQDMVDVLYHKNLNSIRDFIKTNAK